MFGAIILMISNIVVKIIGAFLRIPLTNIIGVEGMAYYNAAYSIYVTFYTISTAGIPVAVSRMIASANSQNKHEEIKKIFKVAYSLFFVIGVAGTAVMMIFSRQFASSAKMDDAYLAMLAIAPTIFFICLSSAYRGYFQGLQNMTPTAVSQIIEAFAKFGIGIVAAIYFTKKGYSSHIVAAYVILGVTIGVFLGVVYGAVVKALFKHAENESSSLNNNEKIRSGKSILKELVLISIPITLASSIMGLTNIVDTMLFANGLQATGLSMKTATQFYGTYTSMVYPLFNLVPPFIYTFAISAIPAISSAISVNNREKAAKDIESAFRNCAVIAIPCAIGLATLSKRVISFLFEDEDIVVNSNVATSAVEIASVALSVIAVGILFLGVISITNAVLQACKKEKYTIISTTCGVVVKIIGTYFLSRIPSLGLVGAALSTILCYFTIMCLNLFFMISKTGFGVRKGRVLLKPLVSGILCGGAALFVSRVLPEQRITTLVAIASAAVVYFVSLIVFRGLNKYDILMMPKGQKLCSVLERFNLLDKGE